MQKKINTIQQEIIDLKKLAKNKKIDKGGEIEAKLKVSALPLLLRDENGYLYYVLLPKKRMAEADEKNVEQLEGNKVELTVNFFERILLFSLKGEAITAKLYTEYRVYIVNKKEDGSPDYDLRQLGQYKQKVLETKKVATDPSYQRTASGEMVFVEKYKIKNIYGKKHKGEKERFAENCIGHTVTSKKENIWINPVDEIEESALILRNVKQMITDANCQEIGREEALAQKGDLIAFKYSQKMADQGRYKSSNPVVGHYIHAAIYAGEGFYSSKNGETELNKKMSLKYLIQTYGDDYLFFRSTTSVLQERIPIKDSLLKEIKNYNESIVFRGKTILTAEELATLSEAEIIAKAEEKMKRLIALNEEELKEIIKAIKKLQLFLKNENKLKN